MASNPIQTRFLVPFDLPDLRKWEEMEYPFDPRLPAEIPWQFLLDHDIEPQTESLYIDPDLIGQCGRPMWRCDLTCPDAADTLSGPCLPVEPDPTPVPF